MRRRTNLATVLLLAAVIAFLLAMATAVWHWNHVNYAVCITVGVLADTTLA